MKRLWDRIHVWLAANAPDVLNSLAPGATPEQIRAAEAELGVVFPDDVRACYRIHDGQRRVRVTVTYAPDLVCIPGFLYGDYWESLESMLKTWRMMKDLLDDGTFDNGGGAPIGPIRSDWWHPAWIPLTDDTTGRLNLLDLAPPEGGNVGQVIGWEHDNVWRGIQAKSLSAWLANFAFALEAGQYVLAPDRTPGLIHQRDL